MWKNIDLENLSNSALNFNRNILQTIDLKINWQACFQFKTH